MLSPFQLLVDRHDRYTEVRLVGALDRRTAPAVHRSLLECLADEPGAMLADLTAAELTDPAAVTALTEVAAQAVVWPGIPVLAFPAGDKLGAVPPTGHRLVLCDSREQALGRARAAPVRLVLRDGLLPVSGAARRGRELATEACLSWEIPDSCLGPACLVATELIANAAVHAGTMMTLTIARAGRHLQISVRDGADDVPVRRTVPPLAPVPGRGLLLVEAVAARWGALPLAGGGKVVWSVLDVPDPADDEAEKI